MLSSAKFIATSLPSTSSPAIQRSPLPFACRGAASSEEPAAHSAPTAGCHQTRRFALAAMVAAPPSLLSLSLARPAAAFTLPPPGFSLHRDKLDGYSFLYPEDWLPVTTSGNDVFYRNPFSIEENLFVDVSSPSSSKYSDVQDLGTPEDAARATLDQYLDEFMSTRIGVRRDAKVISSAARTAADGRNYYDIQTRVKSFASRNQLAVTQAEVDDGVELEWDRRYLTVLGVANRRLYQFRLQTANSTFEKDSERLLGIARSFTCKEV
jgi:hypothetical protein